MDVPSVESQADKIWNYAMGADPVDGDANVASLNLGDSRFGDDTTTDISDPFGSMPSRFSFQGLAQTQTQSQGVRLHQEAPPDSPESQKENRQLQLPSRPSSPPIPASHTILRSGAISLTTEGMNNGKPSSSSHVTSHVTPHVIGASPHATPVVVPKNAPATAPSNSVPLMEMQNPALTSPMRQMTRAVTFLPPKSPPSPPSLPRTNTMPRHNRYAPREIDRSSQDSFASPPVPQDLNSYVRNSRVFNNTYVRRGRDGRPGEVFHHPSYPLSTTGSLSDPPPAEEIMSSLQSEQVVNEMPSSTQLIQAAFDPPLSPIPAPDPVILVKDSQSPGSQDSKGADNHNSDNGDNNDEASGVGVFSSQIHASLAHSSQSHQHTSSSSVSYELPQEGASDATQPNTQSTQPNTQPSDTEPQISIAMLPPTSASLTGRSPIPVPPHRRKQVAALHAARLKAKEEVIPETPASTAGISMPVSAQLSVQGPSSSVPAVVVDALKTLPSRSAGAHHAQMGKGSVSYDHNTHSKPLSKGKGKAKQMDPPIQITSVRSAMGESSHGSKVMPIREKQRQEQQTFSKRSPIRRHQPRRSEIVPDSQEEGQQQEDVHERASSPAVPLIQTLSHRGTGTDVRPPTPTPAAVKSSLRKGMLPEGVTHTRGSTVMRRRRVTPVVASTEMQIAMPGETIMPVQREESIDAEEEPEEPGLQQSHQQTVKRKATVMGATRVKKGPYSKKQKTEAKKTRNQATTADTLAAGPSTRSRKRKGDTTVESAEDTGGPMTTLAPPKKRHGSIPATTPTPTAPVQLNIRVLARRADKRNYFFPGTVSVETMPSDPIPTSTIFSVVFDDGHKEDVDVEYMRQFELEPEDVVRVTQRRKGKTRTCSAQVLDVERWDSAEIAEVHELDQGPDADDYEIEGKFLSVPEDRIGDQWNERRVSIRTLLRDKDFHQPVRNECLAGMGFVITLPDLPKSKRGLVKLIEVSGGLVYDDWSAIVSLNGTVEVAGKRIVGRDSDVRLGKESRKTTPLLLFCLTDEPRTTPKYLIALALGVPCLSMDWVLNRVVQYDSNHSVNWPAYILPAGYNPVTRMSASQAFDRAWWLKEDNLPKLLSQPPILKPFAGKSFLCVGAPEFLFSKKEFGTFPKVLLAMGASHVQAVTDIDKVNVKGPQIFDYTIVDDGDAPLQYKGAVAVDVSWLKKCLVTGIVGPFPWPDREVS